MALRSAEGKRNCGAPRPDPMFGFRNCGIVGTARILLHIPPMAIARRLHHRPIDPRWLEVSPRSRPAASAPSRSRFVAGDIDDFEFDEALEEEGRRDTLIVRERLFATLLSAFAGGIGGVAMLLVA